MKIVIDDAVPFVKGIFEPFAEVVYRGGREISPSDVIDADALLIRTRTNCTEALLKDSKVKVIATATIGKDHIDEAWCTSQGISVFNAEGCNAGAVMNYVFSALYGTAARKAISLDGMKFGVIGVGHVGTLVAETAKKLGFEVLYCDPPRAMAEGPEGFVCMDYLLDNAQIVTLHTPLDSTTFGLAGDDFFRKIRSGAFFINASRGEVVDENALLHAMPKLGPVIIDTWCGEPDINPVLMDKVDIATPHIAGYSLQGKANGTKMSVRNIAAVLGIEELMDFDPAMDNPKLQAIKLDLTDKSQGEKASAIQYNYPIFTDDFLFRMAPENFEKMRSEYKFRNEFYI